MPVTMTIPGRRENFGQDTRSMHYKKSCRYGFVALIPAYKGCEIVLITSHSHAGQKIIHDCLPTTEKLEIIIQVEVKGI